MSVPIGPTALPAPRARRRRAAALVAWIGCGLTVALAAIGASVGLPATSDVVTIVTGLAGSLAAISLATVGAVLVARLPRNRVGWLLWTGGFLFGVANGLSALPATAGWAAGWIAWLGNLAWVPSIVLVGLFMPLVFPSGRLPSPRWRVVVGVGLAALIMGELRAAFTPFSPGAAPPGVANPLAVGGTAATLLDLGGAATTLTGVVCFPLAAASLVLRYRRATGMERAQLRWFAAAAAVVGVGLAVALPLGSPTGGVLLVVSNVAWLALLVGLALLPVAIGIAVLRYRLYDIDRLVSRTISYGVVSLTLLAVFGTAILVLQSVLPPFARSNEVVVAGSTLLIAALFQPLRSRVRTLVDRRFNRARYDAERTLAAFGARLRDEVDPDVVRADILATVEGAFEPATVSLWVRR